MTSARSSDRARSASLPSLRPAAPPPRQKSPLDANVAATRPAGQIAIDDESGVPYVGAEGRAAYSVFRHKNLHRAFAISEDGAWAYDDRKEEPDLAIESALSRANNTQRSLVRSTPSTSVSFGMRADAWTHSATSRRVKGPIAAVTPLLPSQSSGP